MDSSAWWAILGLGGLALVFSVVLAYASRKFAVQVDPRIARVREAVAGVNCGACGYASCDAFAEAVVEGGARVSGCVPGGEKVARELAAMLGVEVGETGHKLVAVVHCQGGREEAKGLFRYHGIWDCGAAVLVSGGPKACAYGCVGMGGCARACPFGAIRMGPNELPVVDDNLCTACGKCVSACPKRIISLIPMHEKVYLACSNKDKGRGVKDICTVGCIGCGVCVKVTPGEGIRMEGGLPVIDFGQQPNLIPAAHKCPQHCFVDKAPFRSKVSITPACDGCELCKGACPVKAIEGESRQKHRVILDKCIGCGLCIPVCPRKAIVAMGALGYAETSKTG